MNLRVPLAVPISIRAIESPWSDEAMTLDFSNAGVGLETSRLYSPGDALQVRLNLGEWAKRGEISARVVHVDPLPGVAEMRVALAWTEAHLPQLRLFDR